MKKLLAVLALTAMATAAQAAVTPLQSGNVSNLTTDFSHDFSFNKFDPALGTLTGVSLAWSWNATSTASLTNTSNSSQTFSWISSLNFFLDDVPLNIAETASTTLFNVPRGPLAAGATNNLGTVNRDSGGFISVPVGNLALFVGPGASTLTCSTATSSNFTGGGGNINVDQTTSGGCGFQIQYTYDAVVPPAIPEPGSLALVGLALAGLGAVARRRKA